MAHVFGGCHRRYPVAMVRTANRWSVPLESDAAYTCPRCSETNYVAVDPSGGRRQSFIEDCPVCCNPIDFVVTFDREGDALVERAELAE
jgi:hypothetical protein